MGRHWIAGVSDARIPDGIAEIDVSERFRDAFMRDVHRLGAIPWRERERSLQNLTRGPCGISKVRASLLGGHISLLCIARCHSGILPAQRQFDVKRAGGFMTA